MEYTNRFGQTFQARIRYIPDDRDIGIVVSRSEWPQPECIPLDDATEYPFVTIRSRQRFV